MPLTQFVEIVVGSTVATVSQTYLLKMKEVMYIQCVHIQFMIYHK